jgi:hypothetical protein
MVAGYIHESDKWTKRERGGGCAIHHCRGLPLPCRHGHRASVHEGQRPTGVGALLPQAQAGRAKSGICCIWAVRRQISRRSNCRRTVSQRDSSRPRAFLGSPRVSPGSAHHPMDSPGRRLDADHRMSLLTMSSRSRHQSGAGTCPVPAGHVSAPMSQQSQQPQGYPAVCNSPLSH